MSLSSLLSNLQAASVRRPLPHQLLFTLRHFPDQDISHTHGYCYPSRQLTSYNELATETGIANVLSRLHLQTSV